MSKIKFEAKASARHLERLKGELRRHERLETTLSANAHKFGFDLDDRMRGVFLARYPRSKQCSSQSLPPNETL